MCYPGFKPLLLSNASSVVPLRRAFIIEEVLPLHFLAGFLTLLVALTALFKAKTNADRAPGIIMLVLWVTLLSLACS
jgi:hypothetical protein